MKKKAAVIAVVAALGAAGCYVVATPSGVAVGVPVVQPVLSPIPGTAIHVVTNAPGDVFYYAGRYYRYYDGYWWRSTYWSGGWVVVRTVPTVFLSIPTTHPRYRVVRHHPLYRPPVRVKPVKPVKVAPVRKRPVVSPPAVRKSPRPPAVRKAPPRPRPAPKPKKPVKKKPAEEEEKKGK
jgi:hypothetical protein